MDRWEEDTDKNIKKGKKNVLIFFVIILIVLALLTLIIGFLIILWPGILFTILGNRKV